MYQVLYREYRPKTFEEVIGQENIVKILKSQIDTDSVNHAYLFCGTRGTGKTTTARLLAKGLNCTSDSNRPCGKCDDCLRIAEGRHFDVVEIDAASNNGIDDIKELRENVQYSPVSGRKKIYIIDEVHMVSKQAFNALLKTLEEPPEDVVFILATTDPQRLPGTILSRCMRLDFKRVSEKELIDRMAMISEQHNIQITDSALALIAMNADGSVRDALTLLEQCTAGRNELIDRDMVLEALGAVADEVYVRITEKILDGEVSEVLLILDEVFRGGVDARQIIAGMIGHYRNILLVKHSKNPESYINISSENIERIVPQTERMTLADISDAILELSRASYDAIYSTQPRILLELAVVKLAKGMELKQSNFLEENKSMRELVYKKTVNIKSAENNLNQAKGENEAELSREDVTSLGKDAAKEDSIVPGSRDDEEGAVSENEMFSANMSEENSAEAEEEEEIDKESKCEEDEDVSGKVKEVLRKVEDDIGEIFAIREGECITIFYESYKHREKFAEKCAEIKSALNGELGGIKTLVFQDIAQKADSKRVKPEDIGIKGLDIFM